MDAADLRVFEAVARAGSMNRAAAELNTVQSNVTARIRLLEETLGAALFDRHSRGVTLTAAGQRLLPYARKVQHVLADARRAAKDDGVPKGPLVIGSLETTAALRLSPVLATFVPSYPEVDLVLRTGTTCELIESVVDRTLEGALVCGPVDHAALVQEPAFEEELVILTAAGVRSLDDMLRLPDLKIIVLRAGCSYRQRLEDILARRGVTGLRLLEFGTLESILGCVAAGLGITLLPKALIGPVWRGGAIAQHTLPPREARTDTVFIRHRDAHVSSALMAFLDLARQKLAPAAQPAAAE